MHDSVPCANGFWSRKFGLEIDEHIWSLVTKETRLRVLQWNILHNIYPTNILLCKMKVRDDQMCSYCNDVVDYMEHFFFDCPTIKKFWNYIEQYILITFDIQTHLNVVDVLFGIKQHNYGKVKTKPINLLPQCKQGSRVWLHFAVRHLLTRRSLVRNRQSQSMTVVKETLKRSEKWQLPCCSFRT